MRNFKTHASGDMAALLRVIRFDPFVSVPFAAADGMKRYEADASHGAVEECVWGAESAFSQDGSQPSVVAEDGVDGVGESELERL